MNRQGSIVTEAELSVLEYLWEHGAAVVPKAVLTTPENIEPHFRVRLGHVVDDRHDQHTRHRRLCGSRRVLRADPVSR